MFPLRKAGLALASILVIGLTTVSPAQAQYSATDAVPFSFTDISSTGTRILAGTDDAVAAAPIGFSFSFYGASFSTLFASTNSLLTFGAGNANFVNQPLSAELTPNVPTIAVLWDDWQFFQTGTDAAYHQTVGAPGNRQFIAQWNLAQGFATSPSSVTFQAVLFEGSNDIQFNYLDVVSGDFRNNGASATVGIRNNDGQFLQWSHNQAVIRNGQSIRISSSSAIPEPGTFALLGSLGLSAAGMLSRRRRA